MTQTRVIEVDPERFDPGVLEPAAEAIREGGLVGMPTETVYGIAVNLDRPEAVERLLEMRGSPDDKKITVHIGDRDALRGIVPGTIPPSAQRLIRRFWPGPLTIIFPVSGQGGVGVRFPNHRVACELLMRARVRVGAPSANRSGEKPALSGKEVLKAFDGSLDYVVDSGSTRHAGASTVVRIEGSRVEVLREGTVPKAMVEEANIVSVLFVCTGNTCRSPMAQVMLMRMLADKVGGEPGDLGAKGWKVVSAGTAAGYGSAATEEAKGAVRAYGAELTGHTSQPVTVAMVEEADFVYVMTRRHREVLAEWMPEHREKLTLLDPEGGEVTDPVGGSAQVYRECAKRLRACLEVRIREVA